MSSPQIPDSLRHLFDSCRDDFDLAQPAMQPLRTWLAESEQHREALQSMRRTDEQIRVALHEVTIPVGLKQRIIRSAGSNPSSIPAILAGEASELAAPNLDQATAAVALNGVAQRSMNVPHGGRAIWLTLGASLATISAVVFVVLTWGAFQPTPPANPSARQLCQTSLAWIQEAENSPWNSGPNTQDQPFVPKRMRMQTGYGPTICYLTSLDNGNRVFQFVFRVDRPFGLPGQIPSRPDLLPSQGFVGSAYQNGDEVIVTAVEGDADDYQRALATMISGTP